MSGNENLQVRAGRNYPPLLGLVNAINNRAKKVTQVKTLLAEGSNKNPVLPGGSAFLGPSSPPLTLFNNTGGPIDAELVFQDPSGSEVVMDTSAALASGDYDILSAFALVLLDGEKVFLRITSGSLVAGSGIHYISGTSQVGPDFVSANSARIESTQLLIEPPPGVTVSAHGFLVINFSTTPLTVAGTLVFEDGYEIPLTPNFLPGAPPAPVPPLAPLVLPAAGSVLVSSQLSEGQKMKIVLSALPAPANGYLYGSSTAELLTNRFDPTPSV